MDTQDPRVRVFFAMNAVAFVLMAAAAGIAYFVEDPSWTLVVVAVLAMLVAIGLAVGSYPFYRAFMRDEAARRAAARRAKRRT